MVNSSTTQAYYSTWQFILNEKRKPTKLLLAFFPTCLTLFLLSFNVNGQNSLTLSTQAIHSKVEVKDNWSPPTAVHRKDKLEGTAKGYGASLNYAFRLPFLLKDPRVRLTVGAGYFKQRFDLKRPFDYDSFLYVIFYTDNYAYHSWEWSVGLEYKYPLSKNYSLSGNLSYNWLKSFRQEYRPTFHHGDGDPTQTNYKQIDFGNMARLEFGLNRDFGSMFSIGLHAVVPLYTRWRNDEIFNDDPSGFSNPKFSVGSSVNISYNFFNNP